MSIPHRLALVVASASMGLLGCGDSTPAVDAGPADVGVDVPVTPTDTPMVDAGSPLVFTAALTGRQVVPPAYATTAAGMATLTLSPDRTLLSYTITHNILLPVTTQLHLGLAGEAGTMQLALANRGVMIIGTSGVTADQVRAITEGRTYLQITSAAFPDGELRGQVVRPGEAVYTARLSPDQENPPVTATSAGVAEFLVDATAHQLRYAVHTTGLAMPATLSHIHTGAAGVNGPVLVDLAIAGAALGSEFVGERSFGASAQADLEAGRWYVNVHSAAAPGGELRGQILRPAERLYLARLSGAEVVPPVTTMATGTLGLIVNANRDSVAYEGAVTGVTPTAAHLHAGAVGASGEVVTPLTLTGTTLRGTAALTATGDAGVPLLTGLAAGTIYANVHSTMFPGGEIRGQARPAPTPPMPTMP